MSRSFDFEKLTHQRNEFFRDQFRRLTTVLMILLFVSGGLLALYIYLSARQAPSRYYASTTTGNVVPIESLSSPVVTMQFIQQWSEMVARSAYSLNFLSYDKQLKAVQPYFTSSGWIAFQNALTQSGLLDRIKQEKLYLSTVVNGPVVITNRYISQGCYTWDVQLPLLILFSSSNMDVKKQIYVSMTIKRVPELDVPQGIAVTKFLIGGGNA